MPRMDAELFKYHTKAAGFTLPDVCDWLHMPSTSLYNRLGGKMEFRRDEMEDWMQHVGVTDPRPVFFPNLIKAKED